MNETQPTQYDSLQAKWILPPIIAILFLLCVFYTIEDLALLDRTEKMSKVVTELRRVYPEGESQYKKLEAQGNEVNAALLGLANDLLIMQNTNPEAQKIVLDMQIRAAAPPAGAPGTPGVPATNVAPRPPAPAPVSTNGAPRPR
ncbi:MAG: hypothetical protein ACAI35_26940 [Candidatus Methylacidiphilales bacterium]